MKKILRLNINMSFWKLFDWLTFSIQYQCWKVFPLSKLVFTTWYVPHAIAEETDWIAILILSPEKNPITPSSLKIAAVVSMMLWYLIYEFEVTKSICAGWAMKLEGLVALNFWVCLVILSQKFRFPHGPFKQVCVLSLVLITSNGVVGIDASPPAIPPQR